MLLTIERVWSRVQDFFRRVETIEEQGKETKKELNHLSREVALIDKDREHLGKIVDHLSQEVAELKPRIKKLESEKHGAKSSAGKAKAANARLKEEVKVIRGDKTLAKAPKVESQAKH